MNAKRPHSLAFSAKLLLADETIELWSQQFALEKGHRHLDSSSIK